jgi:D-glycero-D-manno-heptose 1,7-bisphosphate phosphatase
MVDIGDRYAVDLSTVPVVSDTLRDMEAASAAGCPAHLILSGRAAQLDESQREQTLQRVPAVRIHASLSAFVDDWVGELPAHEGGRRSGA